ncbi:MAG: SusC/RagA family TonB-linked outer membrane protein [Bacteroidota bacterium]|nr:SusC/RagA family TonB-linked outer membrane protein [Bacteroidota bacterium]
MIFSINRKLLKVMKLTIFFLTVFFLNVNAKGYSQITLSFNNAPVEKVFKEIERQTGYGFLYTKTMLSDVPNVTLHVRNVSVNTVLEECFAGLALDFSIDNNTIVIARKKSLIKEPGNIVSTISPPLIDIKGRVSNKNGDPIEGVTVKVKGTNIGASTNTNGEFTLIGVEENATLVFTSTNIESFETNVNGRKTLALIAQIRISPLDEVQVIAYGTKSKRLQTGDVSTVKAEDIARQPVSNPLLALQGRVPGVSIIQSNGLPGGSVTVRIQGTNSLTKGNIPLYVIDGVPFSGLDLPNLASILNSDGQGSFGSPLNLINPADIESIDILKDADATAIYGSRAANGAILITTKKGIAGKMKANVNVQNGFSKLAHFVPLLNTQQYLEVRKEALKNDNITVQPTDYDLNGTWDTTKNTNWQKELLGGTAKFTDVQVSLSGGAKNSNYLVGAGYHRETTVFPGDLNNQRGSVHINLNNSSVNQKFKVQVSAIYSLSKDQLTNTDLTSAALNMPPDAPSLYNSDGSLNWQPLSDGTSSWKNPLSYLEESYQSIANNLIANTVLSYQIIPDLTIKSNFGYTFNQSNEYLTSPLSSIAPELRATTPRYSTFGNNKSTSWIIEPQVYYKKKIGKNIIDVLIGSTFSKIGLNRDQFNAQGYTSDISMTNLSGATTVTVGPNIASIYKYAALFGRVDYNYDNRYIIALNARRDGSSRFGSENQFNNFGSIGTSWILSNERFFASMLPIISFAKIRASYGTTGNDQIGDYQYLNLFNPVSYASPYQQSASLALSRLPNPYIQWEETKKLQGGIDLAFLNDKIVLGVGFYKNRSSNLLNSNLLPLMTGFSRILENFPAVIENRGLEITLQATIIKSKRFQWNADINGTFPKNELVSYPGLATSSGANFYVIGQPLDVIKAFHFTGVDPTTGLYTVADKDGNPVSTGLSLTTDRNVLINPDRKFYGGLNNDFKFGNFELSFLFQFVKQNSSADYAILGNYPGDFYSDIYNSPRGNQPVEVLDRWQKPGDIATHQQYSHLYPTTLDTPLGYADNSDYIVKDASYLRLKNLSFSWTIPGNWIHKSSFQNIRIYTQGQNLFTVTKYKGEDPESLSGLSLPPLRTIVFGIQCGF